MHHPDAINVISSVRFSKKSSCAETEGQNVDVQPFKLLPPTGHGVFIVLIVKVERANRCCHVSYFVA